MKQVSELRKRMDNAIVLRGFVLRTSEAYLGCVAELANHTGRSPDTLDAAAIQNYRLHLIQDKKLAYATVNQASRAFRFLFEHVLRRPVIYFGQGTKTPATGADA